MFTFFDQFGVSCELIPHSLVCTIYSAIYPFCLDFECHVFSYIKLCEVFLEFLFYPWFYGLFMNQLHTFVNIYKIFYYLARIKAGFLYYSCFSLLSLFLLIYFPIWTLDSDSELSFVIHLHTHLDFSKALIL